MNTVRRTPKLYPVTLNGFRGLGMRRDDGAQEVTFFRECIPVDKWRQWTYGEEAILVTVYVGDNSKIVRTTPNTYYAERFSELIAFARQTKLNHEQHMIINVGAFRDLIEHFDSSRMVFAEVQVNNLSIGNEHYLTLNGYRYTVSDTIKAKAIIPNAGVWWRFDDVIERMSQP